MGGVSQPDARIALSRMAASQPLSAILITRIDVVAAVHKGPCQIIITRVICILSSHSSIIFRSMRYRLYVGDNIIILFSHKNFSYFVGQDVYIYIFF